VRGGRGATGRWGRAGTGSSTNLYVWTTVGEGTYCRKIIIAPPPETYKCT
jgi:hypothetical protein